MRQKAFRTGKRFVQKSRRISLRNTVVDRCCKGRRGNVQLWRLCWLLDHRFVERMPGVRAEMIGDRGCLDDDPSDTGRRTARQSRRNTRVMRCVEWIRLEGGKN